LKQAAIEAVRGGEPLAVAARRLGCTRSTLRRWLADSGANGPPIGQGNSPPQPHELDPGECLRMLAAQIWHAAVAAVGRLNDPAVVNKMAAGTASAVLGDCLDRLLRLQEWLALHQPAPEVAQEAREPFADDPAWAAYMARARAREVKPAAQDGPGQAA
jgi:hypothetical protein